MQQFIVTGMSCAACSARVEKAVSKVEGVTSCSVSLLTNSMGVEGTAADQAIIQAVEAAGYGASVKGEAAEHSGASSMAAEEEMLKDHDTPVLKRRLLASLGFLIVLMYFSMGHMMWGWPLPAFFDGQSCSHGACSAAVDRDCHGHQSEVFHQWFYKSCASCPEYGYAGGSWLYGSFWIQYVCVICHDRCSGEGRYG